VRLVENNLCELIRQDIVPKNADLYEKLIILGLLVLKDIDVNTLNNVVRLEKELNKLA
jgi:hypothetical protein